MSVHYCSSCGQGFVYLTAYVPDVVICHFCAIGLSDAEYQDYLTVASEYEMEGESDDFNGDPLGGSDFDDYGSRW